VLIFSQMVKMIDLIEEYCEVRDYPVEKLDGRVGGNDRQRSIDRYNKDPNSFVFLLSTRAGGVGINLTAADTVIIFDSDWNPQNDVQAMARCHRIGQKKQVVIYRLITRKSFEAEMFDRASKKLGLEQAILGSKEFAAEDGPGGEGGSKPKMNAQELEQLLREGAYAVFLEDGPSDSTQFNELDIDEILSSRAHLVTDVASGPTDSLFNKSKKAVKKKKSAFHGQDDGVDVNDPDFWKKVLPDLVTPETMHNRLQEIEAEDDQDDGSDSPGAKDRRRSMTMKARKFVADLDALNSAMLDLDRRGMLGDQERGVCVAIMLAITLRDRVFLQHEREAASVMLTSLEGVRKRKERVDMYDVEKINELDRERNLKAGRRKSKGSSNSLTGWNEDDALDDSQAVAPSKKGGRKSRGGPVSFKNESEESSDVDSGTWADGAAGSSSAFLFKSSTCQRTHSITHSLSSPLSFPPALHRQTTPTSPRSESSPSASPAANGASPARATTRPSPSARAGSAARRTRPTSKRSASRAPTCARQSCPPCSPGPRRAWRSMRRG